MNIAQCYRYFKMIVKMSPYDYLIHYRLLKSIDYLSDSTFNITEISEKIGFQNVNHYIQIFKKAYTLSPKKYQKNIEKGIYNNANSFGILNYPVLRGSL